MATDSSEVAIVADDPQSVSSWPPDIAKFIAEELAQGGYGSESELVRDAVRQLQERKLQILRREIQIGIDDVGNDRVTHLADDAALAKHMEGIWQRAQLRKHIQVGLDQIERGECYELNNSEELAEVFDNLWSDVQRDLANK